MTARLIAITFEKDIEDYLRREMSRTEEDREALELMDAFGDLSEHEILLKGVPYGNYQLLINANFSESTVANFRLVAVDTHDVIFETALELAPLIKSAIDDGDEYTDLVEKLVDDDEDPEIQAAAEHMTEMMNQRRSAYLEGLLAPYLEGSLVFNVELLDALDYITYPVILTSVEDCKLDDSEGMRIVHNTGSSNRYTLH